MDRRISADFFFPISSFIRGMKLEEAIPWSAQKSFDAGPGNVDIEVL